MQLYHPTVRGTRGEGGGGGGEGVGQGWLGEKRGREEGMGWFEVCKGIEKETNAWPRQQGEG